MVFLFILLMLILAILTIRIKIEIMNLKFTTTFKEHINKKYEIKIILYAFEKIPILKIRINNQKMQKILNNMKIDKIIKDEEGKIIINDKNVDKKIIEAVKRLKMGINEINLKLDIGTENAAITAFIIPIISTAISIFLAKKIKKYNNKQVFSILPIYNKNLINIEFSGIFEIKMIHIINTICIVKKRKGDKNERTSNRRTYDYSYEQH